jgi:hypothetical protein
MNYLAGFNLKSDKIRGVLDKFLVLSTEKYDKMEKLDWGFLKDQVVDITKGNPTQKEFENTVGLLRQHISSESYSTADFEKFAMLAPEPDKSNKVQSGKLNTVITILAMFAVNDTREIDQQIARIRDKRDKKIAANSNNLPKRSASSGISKLSKADLILQGKLNQSYRMPLAGEADLDLIDRRVKAISNSILETVLKNPNLKVSVIKHLESQAERNLDMSILAPQLALLPQDAKKTRLEAATRNINEINDNTRFRDIAPERRQSLLLSHHNR